MSNIFKIQEKKNRWKISVDLPNKLINSMSKIDYSKTENRSNKSLYFFFRLCSRCSTCFNVFFFCSLIVGIQQWACAHTVLLWSLAHFKLHCDSKWTFGETLTANTNMNSNSPILTTYVDVLIISIVAGVVDSSSSSSNTLLSTHGEVLKVSK